MQNFVKKLKCEIKTNQKIPQQWRAQQSSLFLTGIWLFALFQGIVFNSHYFICLLNTLPFMP